MIEIKNLTKSFGDKEIFKNFSYEIKDNIMLAIVGKSGSGKSTLLNMIGLLDLDYQGEILYRGKNISKRGERRTFIRNNINYLFQNYALIDEETVEQNLLLALTYVKITKKEKRERIDQVLKEIHLENYNDKKIYTLSGGEQQRVALARVMLKPGDIILADEPTGNLDQENKKEVLRILKNLKKNGKTIIVVTHDAEIAQQCDEMIKLS